jgi:hypothetical protein
MVRCRLLADAWDDTQRDVRGLGGESSPIGLGRYAARAHMERELADMLEDELCASRTASRMTWQFTEGAIRIRSGPA